MNYAGIRNALGHMNTGQLNYHLKILSDLVSKNPANGKYSLTEKGVSALKMHFPPDGGVSSTRQEVRSISVTVARRRDLATYLGIGATVFIALVATYSSIFFLHTFNFPVIAAVSALWAVIIFFTWRGLAPQIRDRESNVYTLQGGK